MLRKILPVAFALIAVAAASCGRQVTPNRPGQGGGLQPGYMQLKLTAAGPIDLSNYYYGFLFNTSGSGGQPYSYFANSSQNWNNITYLLVIGNQSLGGVTNAAGATYQLYELVTTGSASAGNNIRQLQPLSPAQQLLYVTFPCGGQQTTICVTFSRSALGCIFGNAAPSGSPSASPSASPSPTPTPTSAPIGQGTCAPMSTSWYINWFTAQGGFNPQTTIPQGIGQVLDAPGPGGANDQSWPPPYGAIDTSQVLDVQWNAQAGWPTGMPPAAQLMGGEVINNP